MAYIRTLNLLVSKKKQKEQITSDSFCKVVGERRNKLGFSSDNDKCIKNPFKQDSSMVFCGIPEILFHSKLLYHNPK